MSDISNGDLLEAIKSAHDATAMLAKHMDVRFDGVDRRFDRLEGRVDRVEGQLDQVTRRLTNLEDTVAIGFRQVDLRLTRLEQQRTA